MNISVSNPSFKIKTLPIDPPLLLAPMAGLTHSAFRRLISELGGYGALFTEMLSGTALTGEDLFRSTFTKRRDCEGKVLYQLRLSGTENMPLIFSRLKTIHPHGIDINLGCPAPEIKRQKSGAALFDDMDRLKEVLYSCRKLWDGPLSVKCRLGINTPGWQDRFTERIRLFEQCDIDAITVHPRFTDEKLKRKARWNLFPWITSLTSIPIIANGDIQTAQDTEKLLSESGCKAVMLGRTAIAKPWLFNQITYGDSTPDLKQIWEKFTHYTVEDFGEYKAIGKIKKFSFYFAQNFFFNHQFHSQIISAPNLEMLLSRAQKFLLSEPKLSKQP
ncbi:tRNA dihydrouridine synthase B [Chitinispirillum alkaliphilum]|nr:tRNA dihydrouridine synthase B [Chitinispirillum alkaliphilum]